MRLASRTSVLQPAKGGSRKIYKIEQSETHIKRVGQSLLIRNIVGWASLDEEFRFASQETSRGAG